MAQEFYDDVLIYGRLYLDIVDDGENVNRIELKPSANGLLVNNAEVGSGGSLDDSGVVAGEYGGATNIPVITVNSQGIVTALRTVPVASDGYSPVTKVFSSYVMTPDDVFVIADGQLTITMPVVSLTDNGKQVLIKRVNRFGNVTIQSSNLIDGKQNIKLTSQYVSVRLCTDGTTWFII